MSRHFVTLRVPDQGVEYVLAGRMWVLAGAPQELIDAEQGSVAGRVTQSLFGRRQWSGVDSPVLFAGQYKSLGGCITGLGFMILPVVCMVPRIRWVWGRMWGLRRGMSLIL